MVRCLEKFECWKKLHAVVPDRSNREQSRLAKAKAWCSLNALAPLLQKLKFRGNDAKVYIQAVYNFHDDVEKAWKSYTITHYMVSISFSILASRESSSQTSHVLMEIHLVQHILEAHTPYFASHGSLAIWSTQGMESCIAMLVHDIKEKSIMEVESTIPRTIRCTTCSNGSIKRYVSQWPKQMKLLLELKQLKIKK